jgi:hypothetical protein
MSEKIYCGKGKASKYGIKLSINLTDLPREHMNEFNGKMYINIEVTEMREPDKYGKTHTVTVDTWKPDNTKRPADDRLPEGGKDGDQLPF